jgi:hypothetical protein
MVHSIRQKITSKQCWQHRRLQRNRVIKERGQAHATQKSLIESDDKAVYYNVVYEPAVFIRLHLNI